MRMAAVAVFGDHRTPVVPRGEEEQRRSWTKDTQLAHHTRDPTLTGRVVRVEKCLPGTKPGSARTTVSVVCRHYKKNKLPPDAWCLPVDLATGAAQVWDHLNPGV